MSDTATRPDTATRAVPEMSGVTVVPCGTGTGVVVTPAATTTIAMIDRRELLAVLARAGFAILRGFDADLRTFSELVSSCSRRVTLDPARTFSGGAVAQRVDNGTDALGLHVENGNSPFAPDLTWFLCERAPAGGSQTTVCDGHRVWDALSARAQDIFASDVVYTRNVTERAWTTFVRHQNPDIGDRPITFDDLFALVNDPAAVTFTSHDDGSVTYAFRTAAAHPTLFGDRPAFANSILGPSYNYEPPIITLADTGEPIPVDVLAEIATTTERLTENLDWRSGDIALIDNTRMMHGRREITDTGRVIYNAQSYIDHSFLDRSPV